MAKFPKREADIVALGQEVVAGLSAYAAVYPAPPVAPVDLESRMTAYIAAREATIEARAVAEAATAAKREALRAFVADLKTDLRYAENRVNFDDDRLKLLGWAGIAPKTPLQPPGQPRTLEAPRQGEGWVLLDWKAPSSGGAVAAYKIERRGRPDGAWHDIGIALTTEITLTDQERGKEWEYRIIAVNKAGISDPSNTVMAVL